MCPICKSILFEYEKEMCDVCRAKQDNLQNLPPKDD